MLEQVKTRFWNVASCTYRQLLEEMEAWRKAGDRHRYTCFCDAMGLAKGWRMGTLRHAYRNADAVLADGEAIVWLDWTSKLLRPDGSVNDELMLDAVHPAGGYVEWAKALKPYLK